MAGIFGFRKKKTPADMVKGLQEGLAAGPSSGTTTTGSSDDQQADLVILNLQQMRTLLLGEGDKEPDKRASKDLVELIIKHHIIREILRCFPKLHFESRTDVADLFSKMVRATSKDLSDLFLPHVINTPDILRLLVKGYNTKETALTSGIMLRECIKREPLAEQLLQLDDMWLIVDDYLFRPDFDVSSDAFLTFKDLLTVHRELVNKFLDKNYDKIFGKFKAPAEERGLLQSTNYVTRRQSLKLLGDILLHKTNFKIMIKFISEVENLMMIMMMLRDTSQPIQFEAFHIFKVFVANPKAAGPIKTLLVDNKVKLIKFLENFEKDNEDDQFCDEKRLLINTLQKMTPPE